ncbi:MAG: type III-B CRISPR module RAMP protein Cmr6 [candidate division WOR-3 bacterium]
MPRDRNDDHNWKIPVSWLKDTSEEVLFPAFNRSLLFDKYTLWAFDGRNINLGEKKRKYHNLQNMLSIKCPLSKSDYCFLKNRRKSVSDAVIFKLRTKTRLLVNHGGESVLESNIALHPFYGFPIIYGSAIKGVTRHYCEDNNKPDILKIFGSKPETETEEAQAGCIVFVDAWPDDYNDLNAFEMDVLTPHYKDYYESNGKKYPKDNIQPLPHQFLAVKKGITFEFLIYPSPILKNNEKDRILNLTKDYIIQALCTIGIGAKTGSSYGYFKQV